ncbi:class I SAM-dependent methyltransferase [Trinickia violacea]|uniref:Class I SAM-dependent methyltransferase n=1 Tax=Trinickia violacea TaxID=2571746 RepID=A0A4P8ITU9_9BURK|nr:class I SAM-dependent methyltransferase [Trinickia violacea]QCP50763.1 class I SAM-dependent methyltransferase [Trinickia violacea]
MQLLERAQRNCPVCGSSPDRAKIFFDEHIDSSKLNEFSFASRKEPEYLCYQMVQCSSCDLVYVDRPPSQQALAEVYHAADYDSSEEADDAASAYARVIRPALRQLKLGRALEIGTGTGVFLDKLKQLGFETVAGIEPSTAAIAAAPAHRHDWIREGIFVEGDYEPESFDLICCFMTLEHVREPAEITRSVMRLLRPGGAFVTVTHDYRSIVNRLMGRRSPIIDIEHMQLFSARSIAALFDRNGYTNVQVKPFVNRYSLRYWTRLAPLPSGIKSFAQQTIATLGIAGIKIPMNVGNTVALGFKPSNQRA